MTEEASINGLGADPAARRSTRARKAPTSYADETTTPSELPASPSPSRRRSPRPKRKAATDAQHAMAAQADTSGLLEEALAPMQPDEHREWHGWVELESEPAFFDAMLHMLGAPGLQIQEVFGTDRDSMAMVPKPVCGLVFLCDYSGMSHAEAAGVDCPDGLWFANQTTTNACATVALMNIVMNAAEPTGTTGTGTRFGPELRAFKDQTQGMVPAHRGHMFDTNDFIRGIHNSVARRIDLMSEDLLLDNKLEAHEAREKRRMRRGPPASSNSNNNNKTNTKGNNRNTTQQQQQQSQKRKREREVSHHYVAYVPFAGKLWELDGLESKPFCHGAWDSAGDYNSGDGDAWLDLAGSAIQARMAEIGDLSCNVLAVCQSPMVSLAARIGANLARADRVEGFMRANYGWKAEEEGQPGTLDALTDAYLAEFGLTRAQIDAARQALEARSPSSAGPGHHHHDNGKSEDDDDDEEVNAHTIPDAAAGQLALQRLLQERLNLEEDYRLETVKRDEAMAQFRGRQRDYTPLIHTWARIMAEGGGLREMLKNVD